MRNSYLFDLGRLCSVSAEATWDLTVPDFQILTDSIDQWLEREARMRGW